MEPSLAPEIVEAVEEAVKAGCFRTAARLNRKYVHLYEGLAAPHSRRAASLLDEAMVRLGVRSTGP